MRLKDGYRIENQIIRHPLGFDEFACCFFDFSNPNLTKNPINGENGKILKKTA
jgi:hypothetical protein